MNNGLVKKLVYYGKVHLGLNDLDAIYVENVLYRKLRLTPSEKKVMSLLYGFETSDGLLSVQEIAEKMFASQSQEEFLKSLL